MSAKSVEGAVKKMCAFGCLFLVAVLTAATANAAQPANPPLWNGAAFNDAVASTGADKLHAIGITGKGLTSAIFDGGFWTKHEIFNGKIVNGYVESGLNDGTHGTHVAGTVSAMAPDSGLWLGDYVDLKDADVAAIFETLAREAAQYNIVAVNNSWGDPLEGHYESSAELAALFPRTAASINQLTANGVAVVAASGNSAINDRMSYIDGLPNVLTVGALNQYGYIGDFTSLYRKDGWFILAPGDPIFSSTTVNPDGSSNYAPKYGTSMASPHVTGAITLLKSGARMASTQEIVSALYDSAVRVAYDGNAVVQKKHVSTTANLGPLAPARFVAELTNFNARATDPDVARYTAWVAGLVARYDADAITADEWRILTHLTDIYSRTAYANRVFDNDPATVKEFVDSIKESGNLQKLGYTEYGFMQVDRAYKLLTSRRTQLLTDRVAGIGSGHAGALAAYSRELGQYLDKDLADLYQRLDGQPDDVVANVARQLGPSFVDSTLQSSVFGMLGLHDAVGRRMEAFRVSSAGPGFIAEAPEGYMCLDLPRSWTVWGEGFGGYYHRGESRDGSGYNGSFAGVMAGVEYGRGDVVAGGFAAWANHNIRGDGKSRGNLGAFGVYGGLVRNAFFAGLSLSGAVGDYALNRSIDVPGISLQGMDYAPASFGARGDSRSASFTARALVGWTAFDNCGWRVGPTAEVSFAHASMSGYEEKRDSAFGLSVDRHGKNYLEGGVGVRASKEFIAGGRAFVASAKVAGLYGKDFNNSMTASFAGAGSSFAVRPDDMKGFWCVPEASLSWQATDRVTMSIAYQGRFGKRTAVNSGSLSVGVAW